MHKYLRSLSRFGVSHGWSQLLKTYAWLFSIVWEITVGACSGRDYESLTHTESKGLVTSFTTTLTGRTMLSHHLLRSQA